MTFDGVGTKSSPIFIHDSEEELIQELNYQQFYASSSTPKHDTQSTNGRHHSTHQASSMPGKRKSREEDEVMAATQNDPPSTSLENRISQPESKNARKRRRRAEREALERNNLQNMDWQDATISYAGPSQLAPSLQGRLDAERDRSDCLEKILLPKAKPSFVFGPITPMSRSTSSPTFESEWVSSMVLAGEFPRCKNVQTLTSSRFSPRSTPRPLTAFPPSPAVPDVLPPVHIHSDLMSTEAPTPTPRIPSQAIPQTKSQQQQEEEAPPIGMKPEQDPNSRHGIFHITYNTKEAGTGMKKRKNPYIPNPARTLVMEQLPKTHRTIHFIDNWCRSACGAPALHLFVDPSSATALIEFANADLARKAWASPRLGQHLLGQKSHLLKGIPREDQIKVWWYRVVGVGAGAGVGEIEEGEIEEDENQMQDAPGLPSPRKESKRERKARLAKERLAAMKEDQQQPQKKQDNEANSSTLPIDISQVSASSSTPALSHAAATPAISVPAFPFEPLLDGLHPPWPYPLVQPVIPPVQPSTASFSPIPPSYPTTFTTAVGSSLAPGARGGHDDSASIASSGSRFSPKCHSSGKTVVSPSSKGVVVATTVGQVDDLADYEEVAMDVDVLPNNVAAALDRPPMTKKATLLPPTRPQAYPARPTTKGNVFLPHPSLPARPGAISRKAGKARSKQQRQPHPPSHAPSSLPQLPSRMSLLSTSSRVSDSSPPTTVSSVPSDSSTPVTTAHVSNTSLFSKPRVIPNAVHSEASQHVTSVQNKLGKRVSKSKMGPVQTGNITAPTSPPASGLASAVSTSITPSLSIAGEAMEENLRQLVFASKRARASGVQSHSSASQLRSSVSTDANVNPPLQKLVANVPPLNDAPNSEQPDEKAKMPNPSAVETSVSSSTPTLSATSLKQSTTDTSSFEDLAVTFITRTIEGVKANNNQLQPDLRLQSINSSLGGALTSVSATPPPSTPSPTTLSIPAPAGGVISDKLTNSSAYLTKSELSAKQRRLENHIQESKSLMERISTAKSKLEKDLLLKIMSEKLRLFEEESKACEKKIANPRSTTTKHTKTQTTAILQFQLWPTTQSNQILVLSDDED